MSEDDSFKDAKLALLQPYINNSLLIAYDDDLTFFVLLLYCDAWFGDRFVAGVDSRRQPDDAVFLGKVKRHLKSRDGSVVWVYLDDPCVGKLANHVVVDVLC